MVSQNIKYNYPNNYNKYLGRLRLLREQIFIRNPDSPKIVREAEDSLIVGGIVEGLYSREMIEESLEDQGMLRYDAIRAIEDLIDYQRQLEALVK